MLTQRHTQCLVRLSLPPLEPLSSLRISLEPLDLVRICDIRVQHLHQSIRAIKYNIINRQVARAIRFDDARNLADVLLLHGATYPEHFVRKIVNKWVVRVFILVDDSD